MKLDKSYKYAICINEVDYSNKLDINNPSSFLNIYTHLVNYKSGIVAITYRNKVLLDWIEFKKIKNTDTGIIGISNTGKKYQFFKKKNEAKINLAINIVQYFMDLIEKYQDKIDKLYKVK